jgi:hypothetical protein
LYSTNLLSFINSQAEVPYKEVMVTTTDGAS